MENEILENDTPENETETVEPESTEEATEEAEEETPEATQEEPALKSALAQKEHFRNKLKEAEAKLAKAQKAGAAPTALDVEDYIDISTSLSGLDPVEQAYLARQHKLTGESMKEIRESEDFQLWNTAYKQKQEAERALKPNSQQEVEDAPKSLTDRLKGASIEEKQRILAEAGMYKDNKQHIQRADIGNKVSTQ